MPKIFIICCIICLTLGPQLALAHPGYLDQYGGHVCQDNCSSWGLTHGQYHYHHIPNEPGYYSGNFNNSYEAIFYQPEVEADKLLIQPLSLINADPEKYQLAENQHLDLNYCDNAQIFAPGIYNQEEQLRIKPVCLDHDQIVRAKSSINPQSYFKEIPGNLFEPITKVYHIEIHDNGKQVYTDRPELEELKGKLIQGETDTVLYYVLANANPLKLRPVSIAKAKSLKGWNYQDLIVYFDDSIIYSYPIGSYLQ